MSIRSGDRARANKQATKRRVRRQQTQILRQSFAPAKPVEAFVQADVVSEDKSKKVA